MVNLVKEQVNLSELVEATKRQITTAVLAKTYPENKEYFESFEFIGTSEQKEENSKFFSTIEKYIQTTEQKSFSSIKQNCLTDIALKNENECSETIVNFIKDNNKIYTTKDDLSSEVWFYDNGIYLPNGKTKIKEVSRNILGSAFTPQRANRVIAKIEADTYIEAKDFFDNKNKFEIPVQNGILDINTKELLDFTPEKIFFNKLPVTYKKEAKCPNIKKFFEDILPKEEDSKVMFELFGYALLKDHPIEKAFMFVGNGRNGKGKTISLMKSFLGAENTCSVPLSRLTPESTSVCELHGKLVNLAGDLSPTSLRETGVFKEITGRDQIGAKRKYLRDLFFVNYSKQIFACNELPRVYDHSDGFWDRWVTLEFPYRFLSEQEIKKLSKEEKKSAKVRDTNIINRLTDDEELSGLLNKSLESLSFILEKEDFSQTKGTKEIKDFWIRKSDSFLAFCMDNIKEDLDGVISKKELRNKFSKYCRLHKLKSSPEKHMRETLENNFGAYDTRAYFDNIQEHVFSGISFKCNNSIQESKLLDFLTKHKERIVPFEELKNLFSDCKDELKKLMEGGVIYEPKPNHFQYL